jgi:hypothetical protein
MWRHCASKPCIPTGCSRTGADLCTDVSQFKKIPSILSGQPYIRTYESDYTKRGASDLTFSVNRCTNAVWHCVEQLA